MQLDDSELQLEIDNIQRQLKSAAAGRSPEMSVLRNRLKVLESRVKNYSITAPDEASLLKTLARFPERVQAAIADYEPSIITRYILDVAAAFNRFYHNCPILSAEDEGVRATRVAITRAANTVLANAFPLICLKTMEKI